MTQIRTGQIKDASEAWTSWVPTLVALSGGTMVAKYKQIGKTVHFKFKYTLAGAGVGTSPTFTPPVTPHADELPSAGYNIVGGGNILDSGTANFYVRVGFTSTNEVNILIEGASSAYVTPGGMTASVPFVWASGDTIYVRGSYEAA